MGNNLNWLLEHRDFQQKVTVERHHFEPNIEIVKQGDSSRHLYLIDSGNVRVLGRVTLNDNRQINPGVCDLGPGDVFGELSMFDKSPRSATVTAITECQVTVIDGDALMEFLERNPHLGFRFLKEQMVSVISRLRTTNEKILSLLAWGLKAHQVDDHLE